LSIEIVGRIPIAHEDHARRACPAALAVQQALVPYGEQVLREYGIDFQMRFGLNSGTVVVGAIGDDLRMDYTAMGDTTNLAARMETASEPGEALVSASSKRFKRPSPGCNRVKARSWAWWGKSGSAFV
jgi:class 3 adenylate cyclase